jgi:uncharacterized membrane protein YjgN (DUF898 family)
MTDTTIEETSAAGIVVQEGSGPPPQSYTARFRGNASEYFRIWIVNVMLTVATLGIYSAWSKVRTRRYFYGNTELAGASFDYHGNPIQILKGRIFMAVLFFAYSVGAKVSPVISGCVALVFMALFPWLVVRSMTFNLANTSYRNLRFGFDGKTDEAYGTYFISFLMVVFSLGLAFPSAMQRHTAFRLNHSRFGKTNFRFTGGHGEYYLIYWASVGIYLSAVVVAIVAAAFLTALLGKEKQLITLAILPIIYGAMLFVFAFAHARIVRFVAANTTIGKVTFATDVHAGEMFVLYLTNLLACLATLGLLIPWAMIRSAKYRVERTTVSAPGLADFVAGESQSGSAMADAATDFWDIDLGF